MELYGGIEAGGTKFICAVGSGPEDVRAELRAPTTTPEESLRQAIEFFRAQQQTHGALTALGVASFGPVDPDPASSSFGHITTTPKPGWSGTDMVTPLRQELGVPVGFDTDVNGAALGEARWGAGQGLDSLVYITVGTGVGGGVLIAGQPLHGLMHPEIGHMLVPRVRAADPYQGACPFHGDCLEGLASGPALEARWGLPAEELPADHPAWVLESVYLGYGVATLVCVLSPQRIIMGGGVMGQPQLLPLVRDRVREILNGYLQREALNEGIDDYIVSPGLGARAGVLGAIALAQDAAAARPA